MNKLALCVGINQYGGANNLSGCVKPRWIGGERLCQNLTYGVEVFFAWLDK